jgi:hypothetical protein
MNSPINPGLEMILLTADKDLIHLDGTTVVSLSVRMNDHVSTDLSGAMIEYSVSGPIEIEEVIDGGMKVIVRAGTITDGEAVISVNVTCPDGLVETAQLPLQVILQPTKPFNHLYHQTLTMKMMMCDKFGVVHLTCDQALEVIRRLDNLTRGIPKIIYLVGWQYDGHDTGYPAWNKVNDRIKRPEDAAAIDSLKWLMEEAFKFNTTVSFHINMLDINPDSPLWEDYVKNDLIARSTDGSLKKYKWGYPISYTQEWEAGYTKKRIDWLLQNLPMERAGTIHIDAFHHYIPGFGEEPISPYHGVTTDEELATQKKIFRYWMENEVDVTAEFDIRYRKDPFIGLQPFAWHFGKLDPMKIPAEVYIGGDGGDARFGVSMLGEGIIKRHPDKLKGFLSEFCRTTLPWYYLNRLSRLKVENEIVYFSDEVTSWEENGKLIIKQGDRILREGNDLFVPALWNEDKQKEIIAYSENGYRGKMWHLPKDWQDIKSVNLYSIDLEGVALIEKIPVLDGTIVLSLVREQAMSIVPSGA